MDSSQYFKHDGNGLIFPMKKKLLSNFPESLLEAKSCVYDKLGLHCSSIVQEEESFDYDAFEFKLGKHFVKYRKAKITPTKTGQFVTLWKRKGKGPIEPFHENDKIDLFIISVITDNQSGQFIFPKSVLIEHGILSRRGKEGKRAMRVYPSWDIVESKQAQKTQKWQSAFFFEYSQKKIDLDFIKTLI